MVFDPAANSAALSLGGVRPTVLARRAVREYAAFYRDKVAWLALAVTAVTLCYVGGGVMFWFHAVRLGEGGPAISWYAHWLLDSTFGLMGLTPVLFVLLPLATWAARALVGRSVPQLVPWLYAVICGSLFALATTPGPLAHDLLVGRGTWIATQLTRAIGDPTAPLTPAHPYPVLAKLTQQLGAGIPVYVALTLVSVVVIRAMVMSRQRVAVARRVLREPPSTADASS
jgi:hypothetical protein